MKKYSRDIELDNGFVEFMGSRIGVSFTYIKWAAATKLRRVRSVVDPEILRFVKNLEFVCKHYSPELTCVLCGETHLEFLALDHTNGGGAAERRLFGSSNATYHRSIIRRGFPLEYRVLCHNCHTKYGVRSEYTHKRKPESELSQTIAATTTRERVAKNPEYYREYSKEKSRRTYCNTKAEVLGHYGGKCTCCGVDDLDVLNIDHIEGGGRALTRELKSKGHRFGYAWLKNNGYPAGFRVLCANCNSSRGSYGYCPHEVRSNLVFYENPS